MFEIYEVILYSERLAFNPWPLLSYVVQLSYEALVKSSFVPHMICYVNVSLQKADEILIYEESFIKTKTINKFGNAVGFEASTLKPDWKIS